MTTFLACARIAWQVLNRIDNKRPHVEDNVESSCAECNMLDNTNKMKTKKVAIKCAHCSRSYVWQV